MTPIEQLNWARQILSDGEASREALAEQLAARAKDAKEIAALRDALESAKRIACAQGSKISRLKDEVLQLKRRINGMIQARKVAK